MGMRGAGLATTPAALASEADALLVRASWFRILQCAYEPPMGALDIEHLTKAAYGADAKGNELTKELMSLAEHAKTERASPPLHFH